MAYKLKYYADIKRPNVTERLNIYQKDFTGSAKILGTLQSLHVGLVGNESIEAPIIKSELTFTLVDAWKMADSYDDDRGAYIKYGSFEEFYTSDSTMYLVELVKVANNREYPRWKGYLTPDSYSEQLIYGGSVSFIARDMIGHLSDFKFEETGLCALEYIFEEMKSVASIPMDIDAYYMQSLMGTVDDDTDPVSSLDWCINAKNFEDATWYDVVEAILDSVGATMRWVDQDKIEVSPLRYFMDWGLGGGVQFVTSGTRAMSPAIRRIVETFNYASGVPIYEIESKSSHFTAQTMTISDFNVSVPTYVPSSSSPWSKVGNIDMFNHLLVDSKVGGGWIDLTKNKNTLMSSVLGFSTNKKRAFDAYLSKKMPMSGGNLKLELSFTVSRAMLEWYNNAQPLRIRPRYASELDELIITANWGLVAFVGDKSFHLTSSSGWQTSKVVNKTTTTGSADETADLSFTTPNGCTALEFRFYGFTMEGGYLAQHALQVLPCFGYLYDLKIEETDTQSGGKFVTTTIYNDANNVIYERSPKLGQTPLVANENVIPNGFFYEDSDRGNPALQLFKFEDDNDFSRLSVLVARQLLCFYDKPNSELSGELINSYGGTPMFGASWRWENRNHFLTGGKLNVLTDRIESAVLREVANYDSLWGGISVSPTTVTAQASSVTKNVVITAANGEAWNVMNLPSWITCSRTSGKGSTTISLNLSENTDYQARTAIVSIAGVQVTVTQSGKTPTTPTWDATNKSVNYEAQDVETVTVSTNGNTVTFSASADWLNVSENNAGVVISAEENPTSTSRSATAIMSWNGGSTSVTITQEGQPTSDPSWDAADKVIDEMAQDVETINVQNHGNTVTVSSSASWLTVTKNGNTYTVKAKANTGTDVRSARITMRWSTSSLYITVTQAGTDSSIPVWNAKDVYVDPSAQTAESIIVKDSGYNVTVSSSASWIDVNLVNGIYVVSVEANTTEAVRSGLVTMTWSGGTRSVTVTQSGDTGNVPSWNAEDITITGDAQEAETIIANGNGVAITISRNQPWLTVTESNGVYVVTATENRTGSTRTGRVTMTWSDGSKYITITQLSRRTAPPVWNAESITIDRGEQTAQIIIVQDNGYDITVTSNASWLTVTEESGVYVVEASQNTSNTNRTGIVTMAWDGGSKSVTVTQYGKSANDPTWNAEDASISYKAQNVQTFGVDANGNTVTFASNVAWLTVEDLSGLWRIKASENTSSDIRTGRVTMSWNGGSTYVTIAQGGKDASNPTWDADDKKIDGGSQRVETIVVNPNGNAVTVSSNADWLTVTKNGDIYVINALVNESENMRSARITMTWSGGSKYVTIYQAGQEVERNIVMLESVSPSNASVTVDGVTVAVGSYVAVRNGTVVNVVATASGYRTYSQLMTIVEDTYLDIVLEDIVDRYEVSLNLTNCSASNLYTLVDEGEMYVNTITPNEGRSIGSAVIIQMGGQTLSDVVTRNADGTISINIPSVTGNIGIMVIAS